MQKKISLWPKSECCSSSITPFLLSGEKSRPAILVIPGGGYGGVCETTEGSPIARKFNELGFHAFVLDYRVAPHRFPAPQQDALRAMRMIRANAGKWNVTADQVSVCGFSAGAHLAASLGTIAKSVPNVEQDVLDLENGIPDAMILCYGVLSFENWSNSGSRNNLLGNPASPEKINLCSLEKQVTDETPPAFIWHTISDQMVDYRNSVVFAEAMIQKKRPCELHLFPYGTHGMLLGIGTADVSEWPRQVALFLETQWRMKNNPEEMLKRYTNSYQANPKD